MQNVSIVDVLIKKKFMYPHPSFACHVRNEKINFVYLVEN